LTRSGCPGIMQLTQQYAMMGKVGRGRKRKRGGGKVRAAPATSSKSIPELQARDPVVESRGRVVLKPAVRAR